MNYQNCFLLFKGSTVSEIGVTQHVPQNTMFVKLSYICSTCNYIRYHLITLALLWLVCRQFSMNGYMLRLWVGRDGIMFVCCFSVSIVVSGFSCSAQSLRCLVWGWCVFGFLCRFAPLCEDKKELFCVRQCGCGLMSVCIGSYVKYLHVSAR